MVKLNEAPPESSSFARHSLLPSISPLVPPLQHKSILHTVYPNMEFPLSEYPAETGSEYSEKRPFLRLNLS